jgi:hypothetical protein
LESFIKLQRLNPGFNAGNLLTFRIPVPQVSYGNFVDGDKNRPREKLYERLEQIVRAVPGVESVGLAAGLPMRQEFNPFGVRVEGREPPSSGAGTANAAASVEVGSQGDTGIQIVNPNYFETLKLRIVSGRALEERDAADVPWLRW